MNSLFPCDHGAATHSCIMHDTGRGTLCKSAPGYYPLDGWSYYVARRHAMGPELDMGPIFLARPTSEMTQPDPIQNKHETLDPIQPDPFMHDFYFASSCRILLLTGTSNARGLRKNRDLRPISRFIWEMMHVRSIVTTECE